MIIEKMTTMQIISTGEQSVKRGSKAFEENLQVFVNLLEIQNYF